MSGGEEEEMMAVVVAWRPVTCARRRRRLWRMSLSTFHSSSMYTTRIATQMYGQSTTTYLRVGGGGG